jgi:quinol monooxygenase YgiN
MELFIFARFHARHGQEDAVAAALADVVPASPAEPGCLAIAAFRATGDARLFWVHSRWRDEAAIEIHGALPHTVRFIERVEPLIDHPLEVVRTRAMA